MCDQPDRIQTAPLLNPESAIAQPGKREQPDHIQAHWAPPDSIQANTRSSKRASDLTRGEERRDPPGEGRGGRGRATGRRVDAAPVPAGGRGAEPRGCEVRVRLLVERGHRRRWRRDRWLLLLLLAGSEDDLTEQCGPFHGADPSSGAQIPVGSRRFAEIPTRFPCSTCSSELFFYLHVVLRLRLPLVASDLLFLLPSVACVFSASLVSLFFSFHLFPHALPLSLSLSLSPVLSFSACSCFPPARPVTVSSVFGFGCCLVACYASL
jgi:hypothetical protein